MAPPPPDPDTTLAPPGAAAAPERPTWDSVRAALPPGCRAVPLHSVGLPARILTYAEQEGLDTLGDLAGRSQAELMAARFVGRLSMHQMVAVVRDYAARFGQRPSATETAPREPLTWNTLRATLPESCRAIPLDDIDLPTRIYGYAAANRMGTLGDLAAKSQAELLAERNVGRTTLSQLFAAVRGHLARAGVRLTVAAPVAEAVVEPVQEAEPSPDDPLRELAKVGILQSWRALLDMFEPARRTVLAQRSGLDGPARNLSEIGEALGRSRERVRQLEEHALTILAREDGYLDEIRARVDSALHEGAVPIATLAGDPWWAGIAESPHTFDYLGERLLGGRMRVVELSGHPHLARWPQEAFEDGWIEVRRRAEAAVVPAPLGAILALVDPLRESLGAAAAKVLSERLRALLHVEESGGASVVVGVGANAAAALAVLRASPVPVHIMDLRARVGSFHPNEAMLHFGKGLLGLEHHVPDFAGWQARLVPEVIRVMERGAPGRQWHASALLDELEREPHADRGALRGAEPPADRLLPDWLDQWHLVALLRRSNEVRYLGRTRFVLPDAPAGELRVRYREEVLRILREHGEPMPIEDLYAALHQRTSVLRHTLEVALLQPPFFCCESGVYGLRDRDLPGGAEALDAAKAHVAEVLVRLGRGLVPAQLHAEVTRLSPAHACWTSETCQSVLHGDPRFRFSKSDVVGLSIWESVRVPSRPEILRRSLDEAGGRVSVDTVAKQVAARYGEAPTRGYLWSIARQIGATIRGDVIEWETEGE